jgi:hypothetical protein
MDNGVPIDSVDGSAQEPVNLEDTEKHYAPPSPNKQVPSFAGILLKAVRLHPHRGQQLARSQGWTVSLHKNLLLRNCVEDRERKLDGAAKKVGRLCVHLRILSACLRFCQRFSRCRQAEAKVFIIMCATQVV